MKRFPVTIGLSVESLTPPVMRSLKIPRPAFMYLFRGDIPTTAQDACYTHYRQKGTHAVSASDLLA